MGFWSPISGSASTDYTSGNTNSNYTGTQKSTQNTTGTTTPNLSDFWLNAYNNATGNLNGNGSTGSQQTAVDYFTNLLKNNPVQAATAGANAGLSNAGAGVATTADYFRNQMNNGSYTLGSLAAKAESGDPAYASYATPTDVAAQKIVSNDTLSKLPQYSQFYDDSLINPSLNAYDYGTDRAFSALDARTAGGGGFANERSGLGYSDLGAQSSLGRGQLYSSLKNLGLTNAAGLATGDVNRILQADTPNAANDLQAQEFNNAQKTGRQEFDVNAAYQGDARRDSAASQYQSSILAGAGLTQQQLQNVITANGIDTNAALSLFSSGQISQSQLMALIQAAGAANGQTSTGTTTGTSTGSGTQTTDTTNTSVGGKASFG